MILIFNKSKLLKIVEEILVIISIGFGAISMKGFEEE